jgi:NADPH-dependent 2,4-dienoyl-CoA reductase/sulfur reductase-like enzyme
MADPHKKSTVVIVGAGFAGFNAARELSRLVGATTEIVVINSTDYFLYLPLMPQVTGGLVEPAHIRVSLLSRLGKTRFVLGTVNHVGTRQKAVSWEGPEGAVGQVSYDRLILTAGSVNKLLPIPVSPTMRTGSGVSPKPRTCAITSSASSSWPRWPPIRPSGRHGARSWWSALATPVPRSPRTASC